MPWNDQSNGGGPKGQKNGNGGKGPWGQGPDGGGEPPDLDVDEMMRNLRRQLGGIFGGGSGRGGKGGKGGGLGGLGFGVLAIVVLAVWFFTPGSGWYVVNADEQGVVLRFGAYNRTELSGFHWKLPAPFETALKPKVGRVHQENVGFRTTTGRKGISDIPHESLMLTGDENIVDIDFSVIWQISNAKDFLFNLEDPLGAVKAVSESAMREVIGKNDLQPIITRGREIVEQDAHELIQKALDEYGAGVVITNVQLQKADPPGRVIEAFRDVVNAGQDAQTKINQATSYANDVVPKARGDAAKLGQEAIGYRDSLIAEASGEAARFNLIYNEYKKAPKVTRQRMYLETMERVYKGTDKIILDKDAGKQMVPYLPLKTGNNKAQGGQ